MKNEKFNIRAEVRREITDDIVLQVYAQDPFEALAKADRVLSVFPEGHHEEGVPVCYIKHRTTENIEIMSLIEDD